ncbi:kinesin-like protein KIF18A [Chironomus tepperi]|uniref:kinesin-like protein KIF18A n=1 Tax=Chironomus tepperi TaxID=113505 RepID=UPI00391F5902
MSEVAIKVAVRVRPFNRRELEQNQRSIIRVLDNQSLVFDPDEDEDEFFFHGTKQTHRDITKRVKKKLTMDFDSVFNEDSVNQDIFENCMKPLVTSVMGGYNCSVFVYGATGAGKTYTMLGSDEIAGITYLTMQELFRQMDEYSEERRFDIGISYLEVYNENVMNLLTKSGPLKLREDSNGVVVSGLVLKQIHSADELIELLHLGNKNRTQHPTDANAESSRSHAIFQVHIRMVEKKTNTKRTVKLSMIDLAGSERAQSTKCKGLRFKEGANINKSLLALGNCINKLADGCKHIPYRDSNLTRILKDSLGGNCQTLMIANVSPSSMTFEDTYNTLKYASRAKKIRTTCKQNVITTNMPKEFLLKKCNDQQAELEKIKAELEKYKERTKMLEIQIMDNKTVANIIRESDDGTSVMRPNDLSKWHSKIDTIYSEFRKVRERCYKLQSSEKFLNLRIKFKEQYELVKKILKLDGSCLDMDLSKLDKTIDKFSKEISRKNEDLAKWTKRFSDIMRGLECLKAEIREANLYNELETYLEKKHAEAENAKLVMKIDHMNKVNNEYKVETENLTNIVTKACEVIQENYLLLRSMGELDNATLDKFQKIVKLLQGQRSVKFAEDDITLNHIGTEDNLTFQHLDLSHCNENHLQSPSVMSRKRMNGEEVEVEDDFETKKLKNDDYFVKPKALKAINFGNNNSNDMNATFDMDIQPLKNLPGPSRNRVPMTSSSTSASLKAIKQSKPPSKYTLSINKENTKKFSPTNRIKKLPRTPNRLAGSKAPASLAHRPNLVKSAVSSSLTTSSDKFRATRK